METRISERDRTVAALSIQERLAEARHNELFGWGAVVLSALLVVAVTVVSSTPRATGSTTVGLVPVAVMPGVTTVCGLDLAAGMMVLAAVLVVLGVAVALYCRFIRTRLFDELALAVEVAMAVEAIQDEVEE